MEACRALLLLLLATAVHRLVKALFPTIHMESPVVAPMVRPAAKHIARSIDLENTRAIIASLGIEAALVADLDREALAALAAEALDIDLSARESEVIAGRIQVGSVNTGMISGLLRHMIWMLRVPTEAIPMGLRDLIIHIPDKTN